MILSLLINVLIDTDARPTRAYRILAWMIDASIALAVILVLVSGLDYWVTEIVPAINYANGR